MSEPRAEPLTAAGKLRQILETLAAEFAHACAQTCGPEFRSRDRHSSACPLDNYGADVAEALEVVAELERGKRTPPTWESECRARLAAYEAALHGEAQPGAPTLREAQDALHTWAYSDLGNALRELDQARAATLTEAVQAVDALQPERGLDYESAAGFRDGINAALEALGRLG